MNAINKKRVILLTVWLIFHFKLAWNQNASAAAGLLMKMIHFKTNWTFSFSWKSELFWALLSDKYLQSDSSITTILYKWFCRRFYWVETVWISGVWYAEMNTFMWTFVFILQYPGQADIPNIKYLTVTAG